MIVSSTSDISKDAKKLSSSRRSNPLVTVASWELRRLGAARSTWIIAFLVFALAFLIELIFGAASQQTIPSNFGPRTVWIDWGSDFGLLHTLPIVIGMGLALFTPFLSTDGVARDLKRRTHELLMTTALPSWAYVWGRYLSSLLLSLGLACLVLLAIIVVNLSRHQIQPDLYLTPDISGIIVLWEIILLPQAIILSSIGFALGTLWPRFSTLIKVALVSGWFLIGPLISQLNLETAYAAWDPTSLAVAIPQEDTGIVMRQLALQTSTQNTQLFLTTLHAREQLLPDMSTWNTHHLIWIGSGIVCVMLAALFFRRFRSTIA